MTSAASLPGEIRSPFTASRLTSAERDALDAADRAIAQAMEDLPLPGIALAVVDRDGLMATRAYGWADLAARTPVTDDTLFEIGSIGKSFTAAVLLQLAEEGVVDIDAPVSDYLTWFAAGDPEHPITLHHLLTHTGGIVGGSDVSLDPRYEVWALRHTQTVPPGGRWHYSNAGYKALGLVIEAVTGKPYAEVVRERLLAPLGMDASSGEIVHETRRRLAVGYAPFHDDRPWLPEHGLVPATWLETNTGDGCIAATAADLAQWLRTTLNDGTGPNGRIMSAESFARMIAPHAESSPGATYGYGLETAEQDGWRSLGHDGGMVGYLSTMTGGPESGVGVVMLTNGIVGVEDIARFVLRSIVAARAGDALPALPGLPDAPPIVDYAGTYRGDAGEIVVEADGERLTMRRNGEIVPLVAPIQRAIPDGFVADHPAFAHFLVRFGRNEASEVVEVVHGPDVWARDGHNLAPVAEHPAEWAAYPGHYRCYNPWSPSFRVVLRRGDVVLVYPSGHERALTPDGEAFRVGGEDATDRLVFATIVEGEALRARWLGGNDYYRFFTP